LCIEPPVRKARSKESFPRKEGRKIELLPIINRILIKVVYHKISEGKGGERGQFNIELYSMR
jgi:hypothetical protein